MRIVTYKRVSTDKQGLTGLGMEAQERAIQRFVDRSKADVIASYTEVESGGNDDRPELTKALHRAKVTGSTLLIAKLDRLSRKASFLLTLRDAGVSFTAADMPDANETTIGILAVLAEDERRRTSERTREALQAAKARGVKLGNPNGAAALRRAGKGNKDAIRVRKAKADTFAQEVLPIINEIRIAHGITTFRGIAEELNRMHIKTARGTQWYPTTVKNIVDRVEPKAEA